MGLFDQVLGGLQSAAANPGVQSAVMNMISGGGQQQAGQQPGGQPQGMGLPGGLGGLMSAFQNAGLGHIVQSWIGNGPNQSVTPQQLQGVLGEGQVNSMASQAGMQPGDFLSQLSQHLPNAVNAATPNGQADEGTVSV